MLQSKFCPSTTMSNLTPSYKYAQYAKGSRAKLLICTYAYVFTANLCIQKSRCPFDDKAAQAHRQTLLEGIRARFVRHRDPPPFPPLLPLGPGRPPTFSRPS